MELKISLSRLFLGWGPCEVPDAFRDMPYQPFSKSDRLGKISDWTGTQTDKKYTSKNENFVSGLELGIKEFLFSFLDKYASQFGGAGSHYAYYHEEDETTFHLVDTARIQKPPHQRGRFRGNLRNNR